MGEPMIARKSFKDRRRAAAVILVISILTLTTVPCLTVAAAEPTPTSTQTSTASSAPTGTPTGGTAANTAASKESPAVVGGVVPIINALKDFITGVLNAIGWAFAALVIVVFFRKS